MASKARRAPVAGTSSHVAYSNLANMSDDEDDGDFIQNAIRMQKRQMADQDHSLDVLSDSVSRLGNVALEISTEIDAQNTMLDDLEEDVDKAEERIEFVTKKTKELIKASGGMKYFLVILFLIGVALFLLFLIIYT